MIQKGIVTFTSLLHDTMVKIFSNFDTNLKYELYNDAVQKYECQRVVLTRRSKIFLWLYVIIPSIAYGLMVIGSYWIVFSLRSTLFLSDTVFLTTLIILTVGRVIFLWGFISSLIDYSMDFVLVTPDFVTLYNQEGLTSRNVRTLEANRIKGITVDKKGLLRSVFNFGTLVFYSDGTREGETEIHIPYIKNPERTKDMILRVIVLKEEANNPIC